MHNALRYDNAFPWGQVDGAIFEINQETPAHDMKELVFILMLVPVILALYDTQAHYGFIHPAERLVVPLVRARRDQPRQVDNLQRRIQHIQMRLVGMISGRFRDGFMVGHVKSTLQLE